MNNFSTAKNDAASAHLKTELPALLGQHQRKVKRKPEPLRYGKVAYTFFGAKKLRIMINNKVKVVGPGPSWCLAPCRPGLNQFKDQGTLKKK
jgi:hypothetical protein